MPLSAGTVFHNPTVLTVSATAGPTPAGELTPADKPVPVHKKTDNANKNFFIDKDFA
jgi:hypothetical protein